MKISIVTPSYNQASFVSRTLDSVAMQGHSAYEHLLYDGLSTDGSHELISRYAADNPRVHYVHERDRGQVDAINKGFAASTGEILTWLNSDDYYATPDALASVAKVFEENPDVDVVYGRGLRVDPQGKTLSEAYIHPAGTDISVALQHSLGLLQPSLFFRRKVYETVGGLNELYNLQLDYEYWIRISKAGFRFQRLDEIISCATVHADAKSTGQRMAQLNECLSLVKSEYGYVPRQWISRYAEFHVTRLDPKVSKGIVLDKDQERRKNRIERVLAVSFNGDVEGQRTLSSSSEGPVEATRDWLAGEGLYPRRRRIVVSSFDSQYYHQGLNLIASLHRTSLDTIDEILIYSLGLAPKEVARLEMLEKVRVVEYPEEAAAIFPGYTDPKHRAYKPWAIRSREHVAPGDLVLWMDAGLSAMQDIGVVFDRIAKDDFFMADHDDKPSWPFYNVNFMHRGAQDVFGVSCAELLAPHMCSCMVGHKVGGKFQDLIDDAFDKGCVPEIVLWPKTIPSEEKHKPILSEDQLATKKAMLEEPHSSRWACDDIREIFDYYGHRTQSIYSVLVERYKAPRSSGRVFRRSNAISSVAANTNWLGKASDTQESSGRYHLDGQDADVVVYHHRGVYDNLNGLRYRRHGEHLFLLANGPSLRNAPFEELRRHATVGMNAAYRFWDEHNFYPTYYCCLDTVVMESHKEEIYRLIRERAINGIQKFFLRESMLEYYPDLASVPEVFFLEQVAKSNNLLALDKITTGSFSLLFGLMLGYRNIYLMGVDLNYVEKLPAAREQGRILEIAEDLEENPNYFFSGYQRKGDKYNPPNRHPNLHVRSWENIKNALGTFPARIYNLNPDSALKCFDLASVGDVLRAISAPFQQVQEGVEASLVYDSEREFWRHQLLHEMEECGQRRALQAGSRDGVASPIIAKSGPEVLGLRAARFVAEGACEQLADRNWRFEKGRQGTKLIHYVDVRGSIAGIPLVANLWLSASSDSLWRIRLARSGGGVFESMFLTARLTPEVQCVQLRKEFAENHGALRLQIECLESAEATDLTFHGMVITETIPSLRKRFGESLPTIAAPNRMFRDGDFSAALGLYLLLHGERGLAMYGSNAMMCAAQLGWPRPNDVSKLVEALT